MKNTFSLLLIFVFVFLPVFAIAQLVLPPAVSQIEEGPPPADTSHCWPYYTITWAQADSLAFYAPHGADLTEEENAAVANAVKVFDIKKQVIRDLERTRRQYGFPESCLFYEYRKLNAAHPRALAIVVENPTFTIDIDNLYTCPGYITGSGYVAGKVRYVLLDTKRLVPLDTLWITDYDGAHNVSCGALPYCLRASRSYHSDGTEEVGGLTTILDLQDYNHDGTAGEFALFEYDACGCHSMSVVGYDTRKDALVQFPFELSVRSFDWNRERNGRDTTFTETRYWMPNLPLTLLAQQKGALEYRFYAAHGSETGEWIRVKFDPAKGVFTGFDKEIDYFELCKKNKIPFGTSSGGTMR